MMVEGGSRLENYLHRTANAEDGQVVTRVCFELRLVFRIDIRQTPERIDAEDPENIFYAPTNFVIRAFGERIECTWEIQDLRVGRIRQPQQPFCREHLAPFEFAHERYFIQEKSIEVMVQ